MIAAYEWDIEIEQGKINFISPSSHVLFYLLYKFRSIISKSEYSKDLIIRISGHMCLIRYQNTCVLIRHFSVAKIPITHCSLYIKKVYWLSSEETVPFWGEGTFARNRSIFHRACAYYDTMRRRRHHRYSLCLTCNRGIGVDNVQRCKSYLSCARITRSSTENLLLISSAPEYGRDYLMIYY